MYGGFTFERYYGDTLGSDGWQKLKSRPAPSERQGAQIEWDSLRNEAVPFGGLVGRPYEGKYPHHRTWTLAPAG